MAGPCPPGLHDTLPRWALWFALSAILAVGENGNSECWVGAVTYEVCCLPLPEGQAWCWDEYFTAERCCGEAPVPPPAPIPHSEPEPPPSTATGDDGEEFEVTCAEYYYQEFKHRANMWYHHKQTTLSFINNFVQILTHYEETMRVCAPAALTAMLVKLASVYYEDDLTWQELFGNYVRDEHQAVADGRLAMMHHQNGWPLQEGLQHILELRALGRDWRSTSVAIRAEPVVNLVICFCAERLVWLRAFHKLPWRDEDRSAAVRERVALMIYHKCGAGTQDAREAERQKLVSAWSDYFHTVVVRYVDDVVRADDCSAYLAYIIDHYDNLPPFTIFLHADAPEHIPDLGILTETTFAASRGYIPEDVGFVHLANNFVLHGQGCERSGRCDERTLDQFEWPELWKNVFRSSIAPSLAAGDLSAYCCVQFLVRAGRIRQRPKSFYEHALWYFGESPTSYYRLFPVGRRVRHADTLGRTPMQFAMYIWHAVFGEDLRLKRRQWDSRLPLFMKITNVEAEAMEEEEEVYDIQTMVSEGIRDLQDGERSTYAKVNSLFSPADNAEE